MKLFTNGFPKSGNHALVKACELLGFAAEVRHEPFTHDRLGNEEGSITDYTHRIMIRRDPRNIVVSMLRFNQDALTPGKFLARFRQFTSAPLTQEMRLFAAWLDDPKTLTVSYEDLVRDDRAMQKITAHLDVPYTPGAWEDLPGLTYTWNDVHSDYRSLWTPAVQRAWESEGGRALIEAWGYQWNS